MPEEEGPRKYLACALCIWTVTTNRVKSAFSCCCREESPNVLWILFKQNAKLTIGYYLLFLAFGMCIGFLGPMLEDTACVTEEPIKLVNWAFFAQTCCMVVGIVAAGLLSQYVAPDFLLLLCGASLPVLLVMISFSHWLSLLALLMAIMGLSMGIIDCLANLQLINLYDKAVAPFLQAMHFFYGLGALISPLIEESFLLNEDCSLILTNSSSNSTAETLADAQNETRVSIAFWIMAAIQVPIMVYLAAIFASKGFRVKAVNPNFKKLVNSETSLIISGKSIADPAELKKADDVRKRTTWQKYLEEFKGSYAVSLKKILLLTLSACILVFIYDGLQGHVNEYLDTYAVKITKGSGPQQSLANLPVTFWGMYSLGRLMSILLAVKFTPYFMLLCSIGGCQLAALVFLLAQNSLGALYFSTLVLGLSMSSITPTVITMTEHFMDVSGSHMSVIIGGAALGEMIMPLIEGQMIDNNNNSFVILIIVAVAISWIFYAVFLIFGRFTEKYKALAVTSFVWCNTDVFTEISIPGVSELVQYSTKGEVKTITTQQEELDTTDLSQSMQQEEVHIYGATASS